MDKTMESLLHYNKSGSDYVRKGLEIDETSSKFFFYLLSFYSNF